MGDETLRTILIAGLATIATIVMIVRWKMRPIDGDARMARELEEKLLEREDVADEDFISRGMRDWPHDPTIPIAVREIVAKELSLPKLRLRADDEIGFCFSNDTEQFLLLMEEGFGIALTDDDYGYDTMPQVTIRAISELVVRKRAEKRGG